MIIYIFGNGNLSFSDYLRHYEAPLKPLLALPDAHFVMGDFRGVDTLTMELLKCETDNVSIYHVGDKPRYTPDQFRTRVPQWKLLGGFKSDGERDGAAIQACTHFLAIDFNSDAARKSGTTKNIEKCLKLGKIALLPTTQAP
jgi:hypothetical protein